MTKYPNITVDLSRIDGNAFSIMGTVSRSLRRNGVSSEEIEKYMKDSMSGDYNNLICVASEWVNLDFGDDEEDEYDDDDDDDDYDDDDYDDDDDDYN
jgi:hypothetical protein